MQSWVQTHNTTHRLIPDLGCKNKVKVKDKRTGHGTDCLWGCRWWTRWSWAWGLRRLDSWGSPSRWGPGSGSWVNWSRTERLKGNGQIKDFHVNKCLLSHYLSPNEVTQRLSLWPTDESPCICSIMNVTTRMATHLQLLLIAIGFAKENEAEMFEIATWKS